MIKTKKKKGSWSTDNMKIAIELVLEKKLSQREASEKFGLPRSTLRDRLKAIKAGEEVDFIPKLGRFSLTFNTELENQLIGYIRDLDNKLMPFNRKEFLKFVYDLAEYLNLPHQFNKDKKTAEETFYYNFMKRHPNLSLKSPESINIQKAVEFNKTHVEYFFNKYFALLKRYKFTANRIHNCDELEISALPNDNEIILNKGKKQVSKIGSVERGKGVTILLSINATGDLYVPPLFAYPNNVQINDTLTKDAPVGSIFITQESEYISAKSFKVWLELFVKRTCPTKEEPVLLMLDSHSSHKDLNALLFAKEHHIHMLGFPPHVKYKMQPLDCDIIKLFKSSYTNACNDWMHQHDPLQLSLKDVTGLAAKAYYSVCKMELVKDAFKSTGIWPPNCNVFKGIEFISIKETENPENLNEANEAQQPLLALISPLMGSAPLIESNKNCVNPDNDTFHDVMSIFHEKLFAELEKNQNHQLNS